MRQKQDFSDNRKVKRNVDICRGQCSMLWRDTMTKALLIKESISLQSCLQFSESCFIIILGGTWRPMHGAGEVVQSYILMSRKRWGTRHGVGFWKLTLHFQGYVSSKVTPPHPSQLIKWWQSIIYEPEGVVLIQTTALYMLHSTKRTSISLKLTFLITLRILVIQSLEASHSL